MQHYHAIMGVSSHEAEFIVRLSRNRNVDFVVLGRRFATFALVYASH